MLTLKQNQVVILPIKKTSHNLRLLPNIHRAAVICVAGSQGPRWRAPAWQRARSQSLFLFPPVDSNEKVVKEKLMSTKNVQHDLLTDLVIRKEKCLHGHSVLERAYAWILSCKTFFFFFGTLYFSLKTQHSVSWQQWHLN